MLGYARVSIKYAAGYRLGYPYEESAYGQGKKVLKDSGAMPGAHTGQAIVFDPPRQNYS